MARRMKDPVCGMEVDERTARYRSSYLGETYYFCSQECQRKFEARPAEYTTRREVEAYAERD